MVQCKVDLLVICWQRIVCAEAARLAGLFSGGRLGGVGVQHYRSIIATIATIHPSVHRLPLSMTCSRMLILDQDAKHVTNCVLEMLNVM